ncbi:hypothetical protein MHU86_22479 [Fragilaria crotonensis]|nr:hypothetical protein MHU86_22479 [Fragilaria crotonensis]
MTSCEAVDQELLWNANRGYVDKVIDLLQQGADVNAKDRDGNTALMVACLGFYSDVVRVLLNHDKVDVNAINVDGDTALILASFGPHLGIVQELLKHDKVDVNVQNREGNTALHCACLWAACRPRVIAERYVGCVNATNDDGVTAFHRACENGRLEVVRELWKHENLNVNANDNHGYTALMSASFGSKVNVVRELLQHDEVDVTLKNKSGCTALMQACKTCLWEENYVEVSRRDNLEVVRELLKSAKVDVNSKDDDGATSLHFAWHYDRMDIVRELLQHHTMDANTVSNALHWASYEGRWDVVRFILKLDKFDVNFQGLHGNTSLIWATLRNNLSMVRDLLNHGADVNATNKAGSTALDIARKCELLEIATCLDIHSKARNHWMK